MVVTGTVRKRIDNKLKKFSEIAESNSIQSGFKKQQQQPSHTTRRV